MKNLSFNTVYNIAHAGATRSTEIQLNLRVHRQVWCDKNIINCCQKLQVLTRNRPVSNSFLPYPSLTRKPV